VSTVDAPFVAAYELELDVDLPGVGVGPLQLFYPGATEAGGSSDLLVRVTPLAGRLCPRWPENLVANGTELWIRGDHYATGEEQLVINVMTGEIVQRPCGHRRWTDFTKPHPGRICSVCGVKRMNPR